jgi:hypothetical protein
LKYYDVLTVLHNHFPEIKLNLKDKCLIYNKIKSKLIKSKHIGINKTKQININVNYQHLISTLLICQVYRNMLILIRQYFLLLFYFLKTNLNNV